MRNLLSDSDIKKMREEINKYTGEFIPPPRGREYWCARRIVDTLEYFQVIDGVASRKVCKNCESWDERKLTDYINPKKTILGICNTMTGEVTDMGDSQFGIMCGHDGPIYVGENFGCVNFKHK